jgi:hypothetical protein
MQTQTDLERKRANRERTALCRARKKERAAAEAIADEGRRFEEFNTWRRTERMVSPGELEANVNAESVEDALTTAREFLARLNLPDVQPDESLLDVERRVHFGWMKIGALLFSRVTLKFDPETGSTTDGFTYDFDTKWVRLPGADLPIDVSTLQSIVVPEVVEVSPAVDTAGTATTEDTEVPIDAAIARAQLREERASSID